MNELSNIKNHQNEEYNHFYGGGIKMLRRSLVAIRYIAYAIEEVSISILAKYKM